MQRDDTTNPDLKMLRRTVALLLALAGLAEQASGRSAFVRWSVLWLLRPGEVIAREYIVGLTRDPSLAHPPLATEVRPAGDSAADALRLAETFRTLAALLAAFADEVSATLTADSTHPRSTALARCAADMLAALRGPMFAVERRDSS